MERYGAVTKDELSPSDLIAATLARKPILESLLADTVQTQHEWLDEMEKQGRLEPRGPVLASGLDPSMG